MKRCSWLGVGSSLWKQTGKLQSVCSESSIPLKDGEVLLLTWKPELLARKRIVQIIHSTYWVLLCACSFKKKTKHGDFFSLARIMWFCSLSQEQTTFFCSLDFHQCMGLNWFPEEARELLQGWRTVRCGAGGEQDAFSGSETRSIHCLLKSLLLKGYMSIQPVLGSLFAFLANFKNLGQTTFLAFLRVLSAKL